MAAISTTTSNKYKITRTLESSVDTHGSALAAELTALLYAGAPPPGAPAMEDMLKALLAQLRTDFERLAEADQLVATEKGQDKQKRARRDAQTARLRQRLISTRSLLEGTFGAAAIDALGLTGNTPETPTTLITWARNIEAQLRLGLPGYDTILGLGRPDLQALADHLGQDVEALESAEAALQTDVRETQQAQVQYNEANANWSEHYAPVAAILENLYRLAGMKAHADRLRPTNRRRAGLPEPADLEQDEAADTIPPLDHPSTLLEPSEST